MPAYQNPHQQLCKAASQHYPHHQQLWHSEAQYYPQQQLWHSEAQHYPHHQQLYHPDETQYYPHQHPQGVTRQPNNAIVEVKKVKMDSPDDMTGDCPITTICPVCKNNIVTVVKYDIGCMAVTISVMLCVLGLWLCCLIPYFVSSCKDIVHRCPSCYNVIGRYKRR